MQDHTWSLPFYLNKQNETPTQTLLASKKSGHWTNVRSCEDVRRVKVLPGMTNQSFSLHRHKGGWDLHQMCGKINRQHMQTMYFLPVSGGSTYEESISARMGLKSGVSLCKRQTVRNRQNTTSLSYLLLIRSSSRKDMITSFQMGANFMASIFGLRRLTDSLRALQDEEILIRSVR